MDMIIQLLILLCASLSNCQTTEQTTMTSTDSITTTLQSASEAQTTHTSKTESTTSGFFKMTTSDTLSTDSTTSGPETSTMVETTATNTRVTNTSTPVSTNLTTTETSNTTDQQTRIPTDTTTPTGTLTSTGTLTPTGTTTLTDTESTTQQTTKTTTVTATITSSSVTSQQSTYSDADKQRINGLVSSAICVGSLILIGLAYLSSFVDRPTEKLSKDIQERIKRDESRKRKRSNARPEVVSDERKVSFDNAGTSYQRTNVKTPVSPNDIELQHSNGGLSENKPYEIRSKDLHGEMPGQGPPGKFMSTYSPQNTNMDS